MNDGMPQATVMVPVTVPHAGWYCLHKLALYALRTGADNPKREKDVLQAAVLAQASGDALGQLGIVKQGLGQGAEVVRGPKQVGFVFHQAVDGDGNTHGGGVLRA